MPRKISQNDPILEFSFFNSGFFTHRNQLFAPFRSVGINVISFREPVLDGQNMELTDLMEWSRRPGFSKFCTAQLGADEIVNQFYSSRNLDGTVFPFVDTTERLAYFSPTAITTILEKTTTDQGFICTVGNMTYIADGASADLQKWGAVNESNAAPLPSAWGLAAPTTTPTVTNFGCWLPFTSFTTISNSAILDPNGNVEIVVSDGEPPIASTPATFSGTDWTPSGGSGASWSDGTAYLGNTDALSITNFGFSIPIGSTIVGVTVNLRREAFEQAQDANVRLVVGGTPVGNNLANATLFSDAIETYGAYNNTWGNTLTVAEVNASGFGLTYTGNITEVFGHGASSAMGISAVTMTIYYSVSGQVTGISGENEPLWPTTLATKTQDGTVQWFNAGPLLTWYPDTYYSTPAVILDTNGNLQVAISVTPVIIAWDVSTTYYVGRTVLYAGTYWTATAESTGVAPANNQTVTTTSGSTATTVPYWIQTATPGQTGTYASTPYTPTWNTTIGDTTTDENYVWTNYGPGNLVESFGTSYVYGFRTIYGHLTTSSPNSVSTGSIFGPVQAAIAGYVIASGVVTFQGVNNFIVGDTFTTTGLTTTAGLAMNGQTFVIIAGSGGTALSDSQFSAMFSYANVSSTTDNGSAVNLIATVGGIGTGSPLCNASATITASSVTANVVQLTSTNVFVPGLYVTFAGLTTATFLNGQQLQVIAIDPNGTWFQVYWDQTIANQATTADAGTATFNAVEIYRVSDGGGLYLFAGAVMNPGAQLSWFYNDFTTDANLDILQIAPLSHLNDPPPGAAGSTIPTPISQLAYWQGRMWAVSGNFVYFNAGPDCINGVPEEAWPPSNRFQFAGPVYSIKATTNGLLVYLADRVDVILGGPETISFYPTDFLKKFGVSNPNAVFQDGDILGQFNTQAQYWRFEGGKTQDGLWVSDYLADNFAPDTTYVTSHQMGEDIGIFLSNGSTQILRYGSNVPAWGVPAYPVGGVGALNSIETSVGVYSLMMAPPTGGGYLLARDLETNQDNGNNYSDCYITIGNITLTQPGAHLVALQHIVGYFDAVGTKPSISILPNEVSATTAATGGFITLPEVIQEPPIGQIRASTSLMQLRYPVNMMNSSEASQLMHHLQVKISFNEENAPNTIKALAFMEDQQT